MANFAACKDTRDDDYDYKAGAWNCQEWKDYYEKNDKGWCKKKGWLQKSCAKTCGLCVVTEKDPWGKCQHIYIKTFVFI